MFYRILPRTSPFNEKHPMKTQSIEQQIAMFRRMKGFAAHAQKWFLGGAALGITLAVILFWFEPKAFFFVSGILIMLSLFFASVGFAEQRTGPNIVAAISAYDSDTPTRGKVTVLVEPWEDDDNSGITYYAIVHERNHPDWKYDFRPQNWQPIAQTYPAKIWRSGSKRQPVLVIVEEGVMIPASDPKPVE